MRFLFNFLSFLFFTGLVGTTLVLILTFIDDLKELLPEQPSQRASSSPDDNAVGTPVARQEPA
jgi:hypothetical protein